MLETNPKSLPDGSRQPIGVRKASDFNFVSDMDSLSGDIQTTTPTIEKVFNNYKVDSEYDMMRYKLIVESLGMGHWELNIADGDPIKLDNKFTWSSKLRQLLGYAEQDKFSDTFKGWLSHIHPDDKSVFLEEYASSAASRTGDARFIYEHRLRKRDGVYIQVRTFNTVLCDDSGRPLHIIGAVETISEGTTVYNILSRRENTLDILNRAALILLAREEKSFALMMNEGLGLIGGIADIDRVSIFRNSIKPDGLHFSQVYRWQKLAGGIVDVCKELEDVPYAALDPQFEEILLHGECISGPVNMMPGAELFQRYDCTTILLVPIFDDGKFWGAVFFEKLKNENFTNWEIDALHSASTMLVNALIRHEEAVMIQQADEKSKLMLDANPLAVTMWDKNYNLIDCSQAALDIFGFATKQELFDGFVGLAPEYQPCGRRSSDMLYDELAKIFETGYARIEWTHMSKNGEAILFDVIGKRVKYMDDDIIIIYPRDIREDKKLLNELISRDETIRAQAHWYKSLLDGIPLPISVADSDMRLVFANNAAAVAFNRSRDELIGNHCSIWDVPICGTDECSIVRAKQGLRHTQFKLNGRSCEVNTEVIRDLSGEISGYLEILNDVTDVENEARRKADEANEAKSLFLAQMSHEMRTPLNAVLGLSELLLESGELNNNNEAYINKINNAGTILLNIINDILDISKIEAGKFELVSQQYDVPNLIGDAIQQNTIQIESKPIVFSLDIDENMPSYLYGDELRIRQIVNNLLSNAFKYTEEGSVELKVDCEREGDSIWMTIRVSDTGIGIRSDDLNCIFRDYTRFDEAVNKKIRGTGLGLSITKRLIELMDGSITVKSEYGKGSVFTVKLRQGYIDESVIGYEAAEHLRSFNYSAVKRSRRTQLKRVSVPYAQVLVVDDNPTNLDIIREIMKPYDMHIDCVTSGQEAVDIIRNGFIKYSAVFMDHMMPEMDGMEAVQIIRKDIGSEYAKTVPIIALTANAIVGNKERFIRAGFNDFVTKPVDTIQLDEVIRQWICDNKHDASIEKAKRFEDKYKIQDKQKSGEGQTMNEQRVGDRGDIIPSQSYTCHIDGLNCSKGMKIFGGKESFRQVLGSFAVNTRPLLDSIAEVSEENLRQYMMVVHGIKSSSRGICAESLGNFAESLEFAAKDGDLDSVIRRNADFLQEARKLIENIERALDQAENAFAKPQKDRPDGEELIRLRAACENYDMDAIESVMQEINSYDYTDDEGLAGWLHDNILRLNYAKVVERIRGFMIGEKA